MKGASLFVKECLFLLTMISCSLLSVSVYYSILITLYQLLMLALYTKSHIIPVIHILIHLQVIFVPFYLYSHSKYYQCIFVLSSTLLSFWKSTKVFVLTIYCFKIIQEVECASASFSLKFSKFVKSLYEQ